MSSYFVMPRQQAFGNGVVAPGAKLYFYELGTTTPKAVYTDAALTTPASNPVVADSNGRFATIYLDGTYKVVQTTSADVTVWTEDNYQGAAGGSDLETLRSDLESETSGKGASLVGLTQGGTVQDAIYHKTPQMFDSVSGDATTAARAALVGGGYIKFPAGTYNIDVTSGYGLAVESDTVLDLRGATLQVVNASNLTTYQLIRVEGVENVTIIGGTLIGDRDTNPNSGEHGHGISVRYDTTTPVLTKNVVIRDVTSKDMFGDGIYVGGNDYNYIQNVWIENCVCDNNRRQGASITAGENIYVRGCQFINTNGTAPEAGIDVETNVPNANARLRNVVIESCRSQSNNGAGFILYAPLAGEPAGGGSEVSAAHVQFVNCFSKGNGDVGFKISHAWGCSISGCTAIENTSNGFEVSGNGVQYADITGCYGYKNGGHGISITQAAKVSISNTKLVGDVSVDVRAISVSVSCTDVMIDNVAAHSFRYGFYLYQTERSKVSNCTLGTIPRTAIIVRESNNCNISNNTIVDAGYSSDADVTSVWYGTAVLINNGSRNVFTFNKFVTDTNSPQRYFYQIRNTNSTYNKLLYDMFNSATSQLEDLAGSGKNNVQKDIATIV